ncbi:MAG: universal stress protein [Deltaproteobacteria bacterium]|jgi:nucleotide-binding universal stress UspA family protein|nr:universal stress protein [Deltaproteobacteria bacterium]
MKILVGYDGSNVSKEAVSLAEKHANSFKAEIILAHSMVGGPEVPRKDFEMAENNLEVEKSRLLDNKISCESILSVRGLEAGEDLVQLADENKVDEIIIGVRRRSKVGKLLFGSTAQFVILNASCPVVSVK